MRSMPRSTAISSGHVVGAVSPAAYKRKKRLLQHLAVKCLGAPSSIVVSGHGSRGKTSIGSRRSISAIMEDRETFDNPAVAMIRSDQ
jgi:hypothetical protein